MDNLTGIWIDKRTAKIVTLNNGSEHFQEISSDIEEYRPKGGSGSRLKGGPQDVVQDSKYTERQKQQQKRFFKDISETVSDANDIVIFGPAEMGEKLYAELANINPAAHKKVGGVKSADSMTDNQVKAWVRDYYKQ